ncbi:MAG: glycoside hydrolase family 2, partial [Polaribacter sp.]|nr:glycoside hydrolase family 2 [Polaribacter sp.]
MKYIYFLIALFLINCSNQAIIPPLKSNFNNDWSFVIQDTTLSITSTYGELVNVNWQTVQLPHTPKLEPQLVNNQWQGICWYKKDFQLSKESKTQKHFIHFEGAMNIAEVWVNGKKLITHQGGYLPFTVDITDVAKFDEANQIVVKLNNFDNPTTGPKPLQTLDFNTYGGLYRNVWLISKNKLYITDPILENKTASGGIFVTYEKVSEIKASINIKTHIKNEFDKDKIFQIKQILLKDGKEITSTITNDVSLTTQNNKQFSTTLIVKNPDLWSPTFPNLYQLKTQILFDNQLVDEELTTIGIKTMEFKGQDFYLNGEKTFLRGVNRHQEYPFVGYALSENANYRDAKKIKDAGFDYVRLSHYPQSEAFMKACDELGLVTINAILGWQYFSEDANFQKHVFQTAKDLIRRDRNKASVIAWEVSLNESWMPEYFIDSLTKIAKKEFPTNQCFTAGWQSYGYDIYLQA